MNNDQSFREEATGLMSDTLIEVDENHSVEFSELKDSLWYTHDYAMAIPVKGRVTPSDIEKYKYTRGESIRNVTSNGVVTVRIDCFSELGPMRSMDSAFLNALFTIARDQTEEMKESYYQIDKRLRDIKPIFFTYSEIARILGKDINSFFVEIKQSYVRLQEVTLFEGFFEHSVNQKKAVGNRNKYNFFDNVGELTEEDLSYDSDPNPDASSSKSQRFKNVHWLVFNKSVLSKLGNTVGSGSLVRSDYNKLKGIHKRVFEFLESKRFVLSKIVDSRDTVIFDADELSRALCSMESPPTERRRQLTKYINTIKAQVGGFEYTILTDQDKEKRIKARKRLGKKTKEDSAVICIKYFDTKSAKNDRALTADESFYQDLVYFYGEEELGKIKCTLRQIETMRRENGKVFKAGTGLDTYKYGPIEVDPIHFVIDVVCHQAIITNYPLNTGFRNFAASMLNKLATDSMTLPKVYEAYLSERVLSKRISEMESEHQRRLEEKALVEKTKNELLENHFVNYWDSKVRDETFMSKLAIYAEAVMIEDGSAPAAGLDLSEGSLSGMTNSMALQNRMKDICRESYIGGGIIDFSKNLEEITESELRQKRDRLSEIVKRMCRTDKAVEDKKPAQVSFFIQ